MKGRSSTLNAEALLEHSRWMRNLALRLVGDAQRADDLTQDTWVRALEQPPRTDMPLRGWLATVMRNVLRQDRRADARRFERERRVASETTEASAEPEGSELLERISMQRELVEAVIALDEPYRKTLLLRYFEELTPKRIAQREGIPVATVKTRLSRGLERVRARLDARCGNDGRQWIVALLPVVRVPEGLTPPLLLTEISLGALVVNAKLLTAALALTVVGAGYFLLAPNDEPLAKTADPSVRSARATGVDDVERAAALPDAPSEGVPRADERQAVAAERDESVAVPERATGFVVRGHVIDVNGRPLAGMVVAPQAADASRGAVDATATETRSVVSESDGSFALHLATTRELVVEDERYITCFTGRAIDESTGADVVIVVAPRIRIAGHVIDAYGSPVGETAVTLAHPPNLRASIGWVLDHSSAVSFRTTTDAAGAFEFESAPAITDGRIAARATDYDALDVAAPQATRLDLVLVLERPTRVGEVVTGVVVDSTGRPVADATVSLGIDTTTTDADGGFSFRTDAPDSFNVTMGRFIEVDDTRLLAVKAGFLPGEARAPSSDSDGRPVWPEHVIVRLGDEPLSIAGTVVNARGEGVEGIRVWVDDPTFFGGIRDDDGGRFPELTFVETELAGSDRAWPYVETDASGRFRLDGLLNRDYAIVAMDVGSLSKSKASVVAAGERRARIVLTLDDSYEVLRGRVVDRRGDPVAGVHVTPMCDAYVKRIHGQRVETQHATVPGVGTDEEGRFTITNVPKDLVYLRLDHPNTIPLEWGRGVEGGLYSLVGEDFDDVVVPITRRCHFQVELRTANDATAFEILDANGDALQVSEFLGNGRREGIRIDLIDGASNQLAVGDSAATLVLYLGEEEVKRMPLQLDSEAPTTIRP